jgi:hypothetical protein
MPSRFATDGAMPFGYCTLRRPVKLALPLPLPWHLQLQLQWQWLLQWLLLFNSPLSAPCRRCPEREKVRRLFERSAAERV